jgi:hypothetical protein
MTPLPSLPPSDRAALLVGADDPYGKTLIKRPARAPNAVSGIGRGFLWQCRTQKRRPTARRAVTVIDDRMTPLPSLPPSDRAALLIVADDPYGKKLIIPPGFVKTCSSYRQCHSASAGPALLLHAGWRRAVRADRTRCSARDALLRSARAPRPPARLRLTPHCSSTDPLLRHAASRGRRPHPLLLQCAARRSVSCACPAAPILLHAARARRRPPRP